MAGPVAGRGIRRGLRKFADRIALIDGERRYTYADVDELSRQPGAESARAGPASRSTACVPTLPNVAEFVILYFALQKIGAIPIAALVTHRFAEISQFVQLSGAAAASTRSARAISLSSRWSSGCRPRTRACEHSPGARARRRLASISLPS